MNPDVAHRTPAGDEAVARHAPELDTGTRVLLAAIDGKRSLATLKARFGALVPVDAALERLARAGFIESPPAPAPAVPPATEGMVAASAATPPASGTFDLAVARRVTVRALTETLGPGGDVLALQIERSKTHADFVVLHARALGVVRAQRGEDAASTFLQWSPAPPPA